MRVVCEKMFLIRAKSVPPCLKSGNRMSLPFTMKLEKRRFIIINTYATLAQDVLK